MEPAAPRNKGGRPTNQQLRRKKIARTLSKFHDSLPDVLLEITQMITAPGVAAAVRVQSAQLIEKLLPLLPEEERARGEGEIDWDAVHAAAIEGPQFRAILKDAIQILRDHDLEEEAKLLSERADMSAYELSSQVRIGATKPSVEPGPGPEPAPIEEPLPAPIVRRVHPTWGVVPKGDWSLGDPSGPYGGGGGLPRRKPL